MLYDAKKGKNLVILNDIFFPLRFFAMEILDLIGV